MNFRLPLLSLSLLSSSLLLAQNEPADSLKTEAEKKFYRQAQVTESPFLPSNIGQGNDTLIVVTLDKFEFHTLRTFERKRDQRRYDKLVASVKRTYPLAKAAAEKMETYAEVLTSGKRKDRKMLVRSFEREIREEHYDRIKRMSFRDGRILLRLLDRETQHSAYDLVKELRGVFQAVFWQGVAGMFNYDLHMGFSPEHIEEDKYINEICLMIDKGLL
jgi:hypothetical protein